jgi:hypothetical protein
MRFWLSFLRLDKEVALGLAMAQLIALGVIAVSIVALAAIFLMRRRQPAPTPELAP